MRHGKKFNHLSRKSAHRKAMLANMACSLIEHKRLKTTLAKAKALRAYIEPLITKSKIDTTHSRRIVFSYLKQKEAITELFSGIATKVADRPGGYVRILKLGNRLGDNAQMSYIEFVDFNEDYITDKPTRKKSRRARKKVIQVESAVVDEVVEAAAPADEAVVVDEVVEAAAPADEAVVVDEVVEAAAPADEAVVVDEVVEAAAPTDEAVVVDEVVEAAAPADEAAVVDEVVEDAVKADEEEIEDNNKNPENKEQKGE